MIQTLAILSLLVPVQEFVLAHPTHAERMRAIALATSEGDLDRAAAAARETLAVYEGQLAPSPVAPGAENAVAPEPSASELERAEAYFALGLAHGLRERETPSDDAATRLLATVPLRSARALGGPGALRLAATYDVGLVYFHEGERWRAQLPEVQEKTGGVGLAPLPTSALVPAAPAEEGEEPPDPLEEARSFYLRAKDSLLERLRADWRDQDTRANLELLQRRLAELDEIERQREEQQQNQDDEKNPSDEDSDENQPSDDQSEESEGEEPSEQEPGDEQPDDTEQEGNPEDEESDPQDEPEPGEEDGDQEDPDFPEPEEAPQPHEQTGPPSERQLTREEVMRLLDRLQQLEEEREALEAGMREARRVRVERDW